MIVFVYKAVFNWGKENWCPLDLREYLEYGMREMGRRGLRRWWLSWISLELFAELITKRVKRVEGDKCPVSASACMYVLVVFPLHSVPVGVINRRKNAACLPVLQWLFTLPLQVCSWPFLIPAVYLRNNFLKYDHSLVVHLLLRRR